MKDFRQLKVWDKAHQLTLEIYRASGGGGCPTNTPTPQATRTATPCAVPFSDVHPTDYFYNGVRYLYCKGAISGYADILIAPSYYSRHHDRVLRGTPHRSVAKSGGLLE